MVLKYFINKGMSEMFKQKLAVGGKKNSLGLTQEVVQEVLRNKNRLAELYECLFDEDAWIRMRAADGLEKICRVHPEWLEPHLEKLFTDMATSSQASLLWHFAQIIGEVSLTPTQVNAALDWLKSILKTADADWIVAANAMTTLTQFVGEGKISTAEARPFLEMQLQHASPSVQKRAKKLLAAM